MQGAPYRVVATTHVPFERAHVTAEGLVASWAEHRIHGERVPELAVEEDRLDRVAFKRWRLSYVSVDGTITVALTVAALKPTATASVRFETRGSNADVQELAHDRGAKLAASLLDSFHIVDAGMPTAAGTNVVDAGEVQQLIDHLRDSRRRLPVIVATLPAGRALWDWKSTHLEPVLRGVTGLAQAYLLDREAERVFNKNVGDTVVYGGAIRTYLPGFNPSQGATDHPVLRSQRLDDTRASRATLRRSVMKQVARFSQPRALQYVPPVWNQSRTTTVEPGERADDAAMLQRLANESSDRRTLRRHAARARRAPAAPNREQELQAQLDHLRHLCDEQALRIADFEATFRALGWTDQQAEADASRPGSFAELLERAEQLPGLAITADRKTTLQLDRHHQSEHWCAMTWSGLIALSAYANASVKGAFIRDFGTWCRKVPDGEPVFPLSRVVMTESETVRSFDAWRRQRTFPVPQEVDPSGERFMQAHLRLGTSGQIAPRLYFDDCTKGTRSQSRTLVVGYIGPHLANTLTS